MNPLNDISAVYMQEVLKPQLGKKEGSPAPEASGKVKKGENTQEASAKRIRQAVYDIRYRARREDVPLEQAFSQYAGQSSMTGPEKAAVKEKLGLAAGSSAAPVKEEADNKKFMVRVTDKTSGKTYRRYATREKIAQLRANPNISSVEMTQYGQPYEGEKKKGEQTSKVKSGKGLDPVGREDKDIDNDGDHDKTDKYLLNRRKVRGVAIQKKASVKEGFSNWRYDLSEVMDDVEASRKIKEKKVTNKVKINPTLEESIEEIGGTILEMVEDNELGYIVESVYDELLDEGYEEDDIEEAIEYALTEDTVTYGHDTDKPHQKKTGAGQLAKAVGRLARQKLSSKVKGAKTAAKAAVASGARKVAKKALGVARKIEGGDSKPSSAHTKTRSASTYRGAGAGTKEKVSSGSYTPPSKKKSEKISDPWEGSATTPKTKKTAAPKTKAKATTKKKKSNLDDLLSTIRNESTHDKEMRRLAAQERASERKERGGAAPKSPGRLGKSAGTSYADYQQVSIAAHDKATKKNKNVVGLVTKEEVQLDEKALSRAQQRFMGMVYAAKKGETPASPEVAKAAAGISKKAARDFAKTKHAKLPEKKVEEAVTQVSGRETNPPSGTTAKQDDVQRKQMLANKQKMIQKQQMLQRQEVQMQKQGKLPIGDAVESVEYDLEEGMTMRDFKKKRSAQKQKEKRADAKTSPLRRAGIHDPKASPERAARHRANVDPDYDRDDDEQMYPGGKLKNAKKIRKAKAVGELTKEELVTELRRSEKEGMGSPEKRTASGKLVGSRGERKRKGEMGGRHYWSGGEGGSRTERGKKKNEAGSEHQRLNRPEPKNRQMARGSAAAMQRWHFPRD